MDGLCAVLSEVVLSEPVSYSGVAAFPEFAGIV
jgi:hypothetical protein